MSATVDVLAVLDLAACRERDAGQPDGVQLAARAAVAELIEALRPYGMERDSMPGTPSGLRRLRAAWKRVQGVQS